MVKGKSLKRKTAMKLCWPHFPLTFLLSSSPSPLSPPLQGPAHPDGEVFLAFEKMLPYLELMEEKRHKNNQGSEIK